MSLVPFLLIAFIGATASLVVRGPDRLATAIGLVGLVGAIIAALAIRPGSSLLVGGSGIATTEYVRLYLVLGSVVGLILVVVGAAAGSRRDASAVTLAILGTSGLALALPDPRIAVLAATAGGIFGALVCVAPLGGRAGATVGVRVLRASIVAGTMAIAATAWIGRDLSDLAARPVVFELAFLAMGIAVAIRFGAIPLHGWAARLTDAVPETTLPLVTGWGPSALAIVAVAWADASIAPLLVDVESARLVILAIAIASITLAALAAWIQDDLEHLVGYAIIGDAGVVMLAVAALDPTAWEPARMWILAFVVARSALAAWAAATRTTFFTGRIQDLHGWAIRSPILAAAFVVTVIAGVGLPGLAAFDARGALIDLTLDGPVALLVWLGVLAPLLTYGRLFVVGIERPEPGSGGPGWRPRFGPLRLTDLRGWTTMTWEDNKAPFASIAALVLAVLAIGVSAGLFGGPDASAGLPPTLDQAVESFEPEPSVEPEASVEPEPSGEPEPGGSGPSFEPVPTP
jgi:formate hydrogenlyase subunit 3/multisubunit Na+/H+ antiporter MnhD subunit